MSSLSEKRKVTVNGVEYEVEIQFDDGKWEVTIDGKLYEVETDQGSRRGQRKKRDSNRGGGPSSGLISSAIPGKIVSVLVSEGDKVDSGSVVIVLEAMKMQHEILADVSGKINHIAATAGSQVRLDEVIMEIEKDKNE